MPAPDTATVACATRVEAQRAGGVERVTHTDRVRVLCARQTCQARRASGCPGHAGARTCAVSIPSSRRNRGCGTEASAAGCSGHSATVRRTEAGEQHLRLGSFGNPQGLEGTSRPIVGNPKGFGGVHQVRRQPQGSIGLCDPLPVAAKSAAIVLSTKAEHPAFPHGLSSTSGFLPGLTPNCAIGTVHCTSCAPLPYLATVRVLSRCLQAPSPWGEQGVADTRNLCHLPAMCSKRARFCCSIADPRLLTPTQFTLPSPQASCLFAPGPCTMIQSLGWQAG